MKKKVVIIISVVLVLVIAFVGIWIWGANNPELHFSIGKPTGETGIYIEMIGIGETARFGFIETNEEVKAQVDEMYTTMMDARTELVKIAEAPTHLELDISKSENGKTVYTYHGTLTTDGITSDYEESWIFNYKHFGKIEYAG